MRKTTHFRLSCRCLRCFSGHNPASRLAFLFGSVEPDINLLHYLRDAVCGAGLHGHDYSRILPRIDRLSLLRHRKEHWGILQYYRLGKLVHYGADAFTFPHNDGFHGGLQAHIRYEKELEVVFHNKAECQKPLPYLPMESVDFPSLLRWRHDMYKQAEQAGGNLKKDAIYIQRIVQAAVDIFLPAGVSKGLPEWIGRPAGTAGSHS